MCVCERVCARVLGFSVCVSMCVSLWMCLWTFICVDAHKFQCLCMCVCVWTPLKTPSQAPLFWGGNVAINSRVSPGSDPAIEALARK